jgi:nitroreductase
MEIDPRLLRVLTAAATAPSVHNSQPWRLRALSPTQVALEQDSSRRVPEADPHGRQLVASLGAFLATAQRAAAGLGARLEVERTPAAEAAQVAVLALSGETAVEPGWLDAISRRQTSRVPFGPDALTADARAALEIQPPGASVIVVEDAGELEQLAEVVANATRRTFAAPAFRKELSEHLGAQPGEASGDGASQAAERRRCVIASAAVLLICTPEDQPADWLRAGEAMGAAWLEAARLGLAGQPLTAAVESPEERALLDEAVGAGRVQAMLRVGAGGAAPARPARRPFESLWKT